MTPSRPVHERVLLLECEGDRLLGILSEAAPDRDAAIGVVIVVGGPQYRAGSHRQFVQLARELADAGFPTLRFDVRGMGDSTGSARSFEHLTSDIGAAIDGLLSHTPRLQRVVLWGLCDGASALLLYLADRDDPRIAGAVVANPWVRGEQTQARTKLKHYYVQRMLSAGFWRKLFSGRIRLGAITEFWSTARAVTNPSATRSGADEGLVESHSAYTDRMTLAATSGRVPLLLMLSGQDYTAREFLEFVQQSKAWHRALTSPHVTRLDLNDADHTFSRPEDLAKSISGTCAWLQTL